MLSRLRSRLRQESLRHIGRHCGADALSELRSGTKLPPVVLLQPEEMRRSRPCLPFSCIWRSSTFSSLWRSSAYFAAGSSTAGRV